MSSSQSFPDREPPSTSPLFKPIDSARDSSIALQRVTLLYEAMPAALVAGLGCALALIAVNWHVVPHDRLLVWLVYHLILSAGRYGLARSFRANKPGLVNIERWDRAFLVGTTLAGLGWGASALLLFPESSPAHQVFLAFVLAGITAGAASTLAARFDAFLSFSLPMLTPLILRLFALDHEQALPMAICTMLFSLLMVYTAYRTSNTVLETLRLKYHNAQLVDQLTGQLQEGEQTALLLNVHSEHYRFIMEYAEDIIYRTDRSGRFTFINPAVIRLLGYHETDMLGHRALDLVHPHYRRTTEHFYIRQFLRKIPSTYYEFPLVTRNRQTLWVGQNVQLLLRDQEVIGFQAVMRDISSRNRPKKRYASARSDTARCSRAAPKCC
jgi:two-component system cell cycle sensor histidine kinase/response regulator CckA